MTSIHPLITATVITAAVSRSTYGKYVVEAKLDSGAYVIANSQGKMTVRLSSGSLAPGEVVAVKAMGKDLIIEKISELAALVAKSSSPDALEISVGPEDFARQAPSCADTPASAQAARIKSVSLVLPEPVPEGFYSFDSLEDALSWAVLNGSDPGDFDSKRLLEETEDPAVVLRIAGNESGESTATIIPIEKAAFELNHFVNSTLQNPVWKAFSPSMLGQILTDRGAILLSRLINVDRALLPEHSDASATSVRSTANQSQAASSPVTKSALTPILVQWLNVALDEKTPLSALTRGVSQAGASPIPGLIDAIKNTKDFARLGFSKAFGAVDFSLDSMHPGNAQARQNLVPRVMNELGINFERTLADFDPARGSELALAPSVKQRLALIVESDPGERPNDGPALLDEFFSKMSKALKSSAPEASPTANPPPGNSNQADGAHEGLADAEKEFVAAIRAVFSGDVSTALNRVKEAADRLGIKFQDIASALSKLIDKESAALHDATGASGDDREKSLKKIIDRLESVFMSRPEIPEHSLNASLHPGQSGAHAQTTGQYMDFVKEQAQTALGHIESLQVLAKQTPAAGGEQQLVVLPMKLDGQWTDVVIKMVKRRGGRKNGDKGKTLSVAINVAPTFLGDISMSMDYSGKRDFHVTMKFEKDHTRSWFEKNKTALAESLRGIGFSSPRIDLHSAQSVQKQSPGPLPENSDSGAIDVIA